MDKGLVWLRRKFSLKHTGVEVEFSNDAEGVEKLVYIERNILAYYKNAFKKEKPDFLTTHPILSLFSPGSLSNDFQW